ncbi:MAG: HD domain-containing phosphohydrolase [Thermodesulfobacteriota bacterium]
MAYPSLLVESGLFQGSKYLIYSSFRIGRHPDNDLQLTDQNISRFHAIIEPKERGLLLTDLGSRNGTFVNDRRVARIWLKPGDQIRVGKVRLRLIEETATRDMRGGFPGTSILAKESTATIRLRTAVSGGLPWAAKVEDPIIAAQLSRLQTVYNANLMVSTQTDLDGLFRSVLEQLMEVLKADRGVMMLLDSRTGELQVRCSLSRPGLGEAQEVRVSQAVVNEVLQTNQAVLIEDTMGDMRFQGTEKPHTRPRSALCVPLVDRGDILGLMYVDAMARSKAFTEEDLQLLTAMAAPTAVQVRNLQFREKVEQAYMDTLSVLANAIEARDHYTVGHTWRVTRFATAMVDKMGCSAEQKRYTEMGGILHDVGKIAVEDSILRKTGPLSPEEYQKMQLHPEHGARILKDVEFLKPVIPYVLFHQERWDGGGYPFRLSKDEVPWEGRLLAVCDAFDAMTSHRPYRKSKGAEEAVAELKRHRGRQFDPQMVDMFLVLWEEGRVARIIQDYASSGHSIPCPFCSTHIPLGQNPKEGIILECPVCAKSTVVLKGTHGWKGELA